MKIILSKDEKLDFFFNALCNGLGYIAVHGLSLHYEDSEYENSRKTLKKDVGDDITYEEVLIQMLHDGYKLVLKDVEGLEDDAVIGLEDVYKRMDDVPHQSLMDMALQNDDATTADVILQTVFLGKIIYG